MTLKILAFGIARDIVGDSTVEIQVENTASVADLRQQLYTQFPDFEKLRSLRIAVGETYGSETQLLNATDDIALIPPVSGG
jgi:molybdopterin converting factor small subunit